MSLPFEGPGPVASKDVFNTPWGENVEIIRNEELEKWLREHHVGGDIFMEKSADGKGWSFDIGPFTIDISVEDQGDGKYKYTATLYVKKFGIKIKLWTFTFIVDTKKGAGSYCHEVNVVGIVTGKVCIIYENKCFYLYFKLQGFGSTWEKKIKLFCI